MFKSNEDCCNRQRCMNAGALAPQVAQFTRHLSELGHSRLTVSGYEAAARHMAQWLALTKVAVVEIDDAVIDRFGRHRCRCPGIRRVKGVSEKYVKRAPRFVEFLSERGIVRSKPKSISPAFDRHVIEFQEWLRQHHGITELTIGRHGRMVMRLLPALSRKPRSWNAQLIRDVILAETRRVSLAYVKTMTMALRGYADWVGAASATLVPRVDTIRAHVFAAERIHADDTTVPVLAKGKTRTGRLWTYVRDDRPFAGPDPPAAVFFYSRDRGGEHPERHLASYAGLMQADAYAGFNRLYESNRKPGPIIEAACWAHARRKFFDLARINKAPIATEAVQRIDALFAIEREVNGVTPQERVRIRDERSRLLVITLGSWLREQRARVSKNSDTGKAIDYSLKLWAALTRFLDDGRLCMSNNAAER
jgi:hypothetical protein